MRRKTLIFLLGFILCGYNDGFAKSIKKTDSFVNALCSAYVSSPIIHSSIRGLFAKAELVPEAKGGYLPNINLFASTSGVREKNIFRNPNVTQKTSTNSFGVNIEQNIFTGGRTYNSVERAKLQVESAKMSFMQTEQEVLLSAIAAYVDLWQSYEIFKLRQISLRFHKRNVEEVRAQAEIGEKKRTEVAEAESKLAGVIVEKNNSLAMVLSAKANYERVIDGKAPNHNNLVKPYCILHKSKLPKDLRSIQRKAELMHPELRLASYNAKSADFEKSIAEGSLAPKIDLSIAGQRKKEGKNYDGNGKQYSNMGSLTMRVTVPVFQAGKEWSGIRRANQQKLKLLNEARKIRRDIMQKSATYWYEWHAAIDSLSQLSKQVKSAKFEMEGKKNEYLVGEIPLTFVLDAEQKWLHAKINQIKIHKDYILKFYQLLSIYGHLLASKMLLPVEVYNLDNYITIIYSKFIGTGSNLQRNFKGE